jgi:hypothetical protein
MEPGTAFAVKLEYFDDTIASAIRTFGNYTFLMPSPAQRKGSPRGRPVFPRERAEAHSCASSIASELPNLLCGE